AALGLPEVVPQLVAVVRTERPHVVRRGHVEHAVHLQDRSLDAHLVGDDDVARPFAADHRLAGGRSEPAAAAATAAAGERRRTAQLLHPRQRQVPDVRLIDLRQRAVALAGIVAGVRRPLLAERLEQLRRIEAVAGREGDSEPEGREGRKEKERLYELGQVCGAGVVCGLRERCGRCISHFSVARYAVTLWMSVSEYVASSCRCGCSGSWTSTFGVSPLVRNDRCVPSRSVSETTKSSRRSRAPSTFSPDGSVTVTVVGGTFDFNGAAPRPPLPGIIHICCSAFSSLKRDA